MSFACVQNLGPDPDADLLGRWRVHFADCTVDVGYTRDQLRRGEPVPDPVVAARAIRDRHYRETYFQATSPQP